VKNTDITKLSKTQLMKHFDRERQEWLAAGMSEADIYRVHFGEESENGRGGDYREWLDEQKHIRPDHKYCPGTPVSLEDLEPDGGLTREAFDHISEVEAQIDLELAFDTLTVLQRVAFIEVRLNKRTQADVANELGVSRENVKQAICGALKKLRNIF
jgi:RNA polymerase sigma factor (sigma-70 family)